MLLDTNVISELMRPVPNPAVTGWLATVPRASLVVPSVVVGELYYGIENEPAGKRRDGNRLFVDKFLAGLGEAAILTFGAREALVYAQIGVHRRRLGRPINVPDAQIAATALSHDLLLATRNTSDFEHCGIKLVNPWEFE